MPTYDYECKDCGHCLEAFQSIMAKPLRKCPKCGKMKLVRLIAGGAGVIFKGSGFYATDYQRGSRGGEKSPAKAESSGASAGDKAKPSSGGDGSTD